MRQAGLVRHLTPPFAAAALRRGKQVEQFIGSVVLDGRGGIRFLTAYGSGPWTVAVHDVDDIGDEHFFDVSEFPPLDPQEYTGEGRVHRVYEMAEEAVSAAADLGGSPDRWVNHGVIGDEYHDLWLPDRHDRSNPTSPN